MRKPPHKRVYIPKVGELVKDTATGRTGVFTGTCNKEAYLRPPGGGVEFSTMPWNVEPVEDAPELEFVHHPSLPPEVKLLPEPSAPLGTA
ncbi:hypothetical protein ACFRAR_38210 [Kitasatospora sp. NPDC056651]|uniref:hypothetical protein n=1 Tax=Kitasatospora sp. NPDC056651 TaxID=3345892 RepID=UPI003685A3C5